MKALILTLLRFLLYPVHVWWWGFATRNGLILLGKGGSPPAPDYRGAAREQGQANLEAARQSAQLSNPNYITPLGTQTVSYGTQQQFDQDAYDQAMQGYQQQLARYTPQRAPQRGQKGGQGQAGPQPQAPNRSDFMFTGPGDQATVTQTLSPEMQALFDQQTGLSQQYGDLASAGFGRVEESLGQPFDMSGVPEITTQPGVGGYQAVSDAMLERYRPEMDQARQQKETQLLQRGFNRGTPAWAAAMDDLNRRENDFRLAAMLRGGEEQSRLYGMESDARQRAIQEQAYLRQLPLSEVNALRTGSQPTMPQFGAYQGQGVQPAPLFNAAGQQGQADIGAHNADVAQQGQLWSGITTLGATAVAHPELFAFSDRRLKRDIRHIGQMWGLPLYVFRYLWSNEWQLGFMADEVEKLYPDRVFRVAGYSVIYYGP